MIKFFMTLLSYMFTPNKTYSISVTITGECLESKYGRNKYVDEWRFFFLNQKEKKRFLSKVKNK